MAPIHVNEVKLGMEFCMNVDHIATTGWRIFKPFGLLFQVSFFTEKRSGTSQPFLAVPQTSLL